MTRRELSVLSHIPEFLGFTSTFNILSTICLQVFIMFLEGESLWDESEWNQLGDVLSHFPALRLVQLCVGPVYRMILSEQVCAQRYGYFESGRDVLLRRLSTQSVTVELIKDPGLQQNI